MKNSILHQIYARLELQYKITRTKLEYMLRI